jgi:hypothetical protein
LEVVSDNEIVVLDYLLWLEVVSDNEIVVLDSLLGQYYKLMVDYLDVLETCLCEVGYTDKEMVDCH